MKILSKFVCKISTRLVKSYFQIIEVLLLLPLYCISLHTQSDFLNHRSILTLNLKFYFHENKTCSMKKKNLRTVYQASRWFYYSSHAQHKIDINTGYKI